MDQVNLWMSTGSTSTNIHYDAYQNILVVLYGCKTVNLYPPSDGPFLYPYPVYTKSANHSQVDFIQPNLELHPDFVKTSPRTFEVKEGSTYVYKFLNNKLR
jgi:hypothetical protein